MSFMRMPQLPALLFLLLLTSVAHSVAPEILFTRTYTVRSQFNRVLLADTLLNSSAYLAGNAYEGLFQCYLMKVDSLGDTLWTVRQGLTDQVLDATVALSDSQVVLVGNTSESGSVDYRHIRVSDAGEVQVSIDEGSPGLSERLTAVVAHPGGVSSTEYAAGEFWPGEGGRDVVIRLVHPDGSLSAGATFTEANTCAAMGFFRREQDSAGRIALYGTCDSTDARGHDFWYHVTDTSFVDSTSTVRRFGGMDREICTAGLRLREGLTVLAGTTTSVGATDVLLIATNDIGDSLWSRRWSSSGEETVSAVARALDADSGFVIAGSQRDSASAEWRGFLTKYRANGDSLWTLFVPMPGGSVLNSVTQDPLFRYRLAGRVITSQGDRGLYVVTEPDPDSPGQHPPDAFTLLLPESGGSVFADSVFFDWESAIDPDGDPVAYTLQLGADSTFQGARIYGPLGFSHYVLRSDTDDVQIFWRVIAQDNRGNIRICEDGHRAFYRFLPDSTSLFELAAPDSGLVLTQPAAEFRWTRAVDPDWNDTLTYSLHFQTPDTSVVFTGIEDTMLVVSMASNPIFGPVETVTWWVSAESVFPPMSRHSRQTWRFITWSEAAEEVSQVPLEFGLNSAYPNPFNGVVSIEFELEQTGDADLSIFDLQGRFVESVARGMMSAGVFRMQWDARERASGIYFARLSSGSRSALTKLVLLK